MRQEIRLKLAASKHDQINLSNLNIQDNELEEIAREIYFLYPNTQDIFLDGNNIGDKGACTLGKEFESLSQLSCLDLQFNKINKIGVTALLALKINHPNLMLALHGNNIEDVGVLQEIEDSVLNIANEK